MSELTVGRSVKLSREAFASGAFRDYPGEGLRVSEVIPAETDGQATPRVKLTHPDWPHWTSQAISASWLELA